MNQLTLLAAMGILALGLSAASAQEVISDPGYCAQFYPDANCTNKGPNNPFTGAYQRRGGTSGYHAGDWNIAGAQSVQPARRHRRDD